MTRVCSVSVPRDDSLLNAATSPPTTPPPSQPRVTAMMLLSSSEDTMPSAPLSKPMTNVSTNPCHRLAHDQTTTSAGCISVILLLRSPTSSPTGNPTSSTPTNLPSSPMSSELISVRTHPGVGSWSWSQTSRPPTNPEGNPPTT